MKKKKSVNYTLIFSDIIQKKFPERKLELLPFLKKEELSAVEILKLNEQIFLDKKSDSFSMNGKFRSYSESDIKMILAFQKKHQLNNSQLASHFGLSKNSVSKWKKL